MTQKTDPDHPARIAEVTDAWINAVQGKGLPIPAADRPCAVGDCRSLASWSPVVEPVVEPTDEPDTLVGEVIE
jgi:hypothetical protein